MAWVRQVSGRTAQYLVMPLSIVLAIVVTVLIVQMLLYEALKAPLATVSWLSRVATSMGSPVFGFWAAASSTVSALARPIRKVCVIPGIASLAVCKTTEPNTPLQAYGGLEVTAYSRLQLSLESFFDASNVGSEIYKALTEHEMALGTVQDIAEKSDLPGSKDLAEAATNLGKSLPGAATQFYELTRQANSIVRLFRSQSYYLVTNMGSVRIEERWSWWNFFRQRLSDTDKKILEYDACQIHWMKFVDKVLPRAAEFRLLSGLMRNKITDIKIAVTELKRHARSAREAIESEKGLIEQQVLGRYWNRGALALLINSLKPLEYLNNYVQNTIEIVMTVDEAAMMFDDLVRDLSREMVVIPVGVKRDVMVIPTQADFVQIGATFLEIVIKIDKAGGRRWKDIVSKIDKATEKL